MPERFSLKKATDISPDALGKSTSMVSKGLFVLLLILTCGWALWCTYVKPHTKWATKTQGQQIIIQPGAVATGGTLNLTPTQKQEAPKKKWYVPTPFVEVYSFVQTNDQIGVGSRFGARWEF